MKEFKLAQPQSLKQAASLLAEKAETTCLMAGGTDLLDELKNKILTPDLVVDLAGISGLAHVEENKKHVSIGALTKVAALAENPVIRKHYPVLKEAALSLATPQLRNVGTVGGNLCQRPRCWYYRDPEVICRKKGGSRCYAFRGQNKYHAILGGGICYIVYPSDLAPALICLGAEVTVAGPDKEEILPLEEFYILPQENVRKENILQPGQILKDIRIPLPKKGTRNTYFKFKERGTWDFAVVSVAVNGVLSDQKFKELRIVLGGAAPVPWRLKKAEDFIRGKKVTEDITKQGAKQALEEARPLDENAYKVGLAEAVLTKAVLSLIE
jgi:xanthine dehydrogenase YagS FAD-binding subunit